MKKSPFALSEEAFITGEVRDLNAPALLFEQAVSRR